MTDIPDEMVERVAKAIAGLDNFDFEQLHGETRNAYDAMARAALKESGWAEMKEALTKTTQSLEMAKERLEEAGFMSAARDCDEDAERARAALAVRKP